MGYANSINCVADYIGRTYEELGDIHRVIKKMKLPMMTPPSLADDVNKMIETV